MKEARAGDVVVKLRCRCASAVLVREYAVADWTCQKSHPASEVGPRYRLDDALVPIEIEMCDDRRAASPAPIETWYQRDLAILFVLDLGVGQLLYWLNHGTVYEPPKVAQT